MRRTFCDKCGKEMELLREICLDWNGGVMQEKEGFMPRRTEYQLCRSCAAMVDEFINQPEVARK